MRHPHLHHRKNDLCFALLMATVFAVMTAGAVAGTLDFVLSRPEAAQAQSAPAARNGCIEREPRIAHSGARW